MVEQLVACIINEKVDVVICGIKKISVTNQETISSLPSKRSADNNIKKDFVQLLKLGLAYSPWNKLYKKSIIEKFNIKFNTEIFNGEDALFNIEYFSKCNKVFIYEKPLYIYFQRKGSLTNKFYKEKEKVQKLLYRRIIEYLGNNTETKDLKEVNAYYLMEFSYVIYQNSIGINSIEDFFQKAKVTKQFINCPEFKAAMKNNYSYSSIQRMVLVLSKFKCEFILFFLLSCYNKVNKRVSLG